MESGELRERLEGLVAPELELQGLVLEELAVLGGGGRLTLRFVVERQGYDPADPSTGATVGDCAAMNRLVGRLIEAEGEDFLPQRHVIEVSTPGIFRKLLRPSHWARHTGELARLTVDEDGGSGRTVRARIAAADDEGVSLELENGEALRVPYTRIRKAHLDPDLDFGEDSRGGKKGSGTRAKR